MVDVYPYLIECLPRRLPIYKERTSNVYLDVYLFNIFSEKDVYPELKMGRHCKNWVDFVGRLLPPVGSTLGVDIEKRVFSPVGKPIWVDVGPDFYTSMCYFLIFGGYFMKSPNFLKKQIYRPFRAVLRRFLTLPIVMSSGKFPLLRFYRRFSA